MSFFIGFVLVMPIVNVFTLNKQRTQQLVQRHGVGTLLYAEQAILHEAIKEDIGREARVFWMGGGTATDLVAQQAIHTIMANLRYVSIENAWYRVAQSALVVDQPGGPCRGVVSSWVPELGGLINGGTGLLITLFGDESGILMTGGENSSPDMAIVVERVTGCQPMGHAWDRPVLLQAIMG